MMWRDVAMIARQIDEKVLEVAGNEKPHQDWPGVPADNLLRLRIEFSVPCQPCLPPPEQKTHEPDGEGDREQVVGRINPNLMAPEGNRFRPTKNHCRRDSQQNQQYVVIRQSNLRMQPPGPPDV